MERIKLEANNRTDLSKGYTNKIRRNGYATGSVFGHGTEPISIEFNLNELTSQIKKSDSGITSLIDIKINGAPAKSDGTVIIKGFTRDPLTHKVLDIPFQRVFMKEKLHVNVPIVLIGEAVGTKTRGILEQLIDQLEVSCLPNNIPAHIEVDISELKIGDNIRVSDIKIGDEVEILTESNIAICTIVAPHVAPADLETQSAEAGGAEPKSSESS